MARTIVATFGERRAAEGAADELVRAGVPQADLRLGGRSLEVATDAILGSAVYDILQRYGAGAIEVRREADHLTGWERMDPSNDPPLRERAQGDESHDLS
ncbi:MAG: hypothetical protein RLZZ387_3589 [Chloroflexota bacterium]|jgi:hypothetical protein